MHRYSLILLALFCFTANASDITPDAALEKATVGLQSKNPKDIAESVSYIIDHSHEVPAAFMFIASAKAMALDDLENAGFLYYAAQMRARFDLQRYPPLGTGGNSPQVALGAIKQQVGAIVNPRVFRHPPTFAKIVQRLDTWSAETSDNYHPGWDYNREATTNLDAAWEKTLLDKVKSDHMGFATGFSKLLINPEYFASFKVVQDYNFGTKEHRDDATNTKNRDEAIESMKKIEHRLKIRGMYYKGDDA